MRITEQGKNLQDLANRLNVKIVRQSLKKFNNLRGVTLFEGKTIYVCLDENLTKAQEYATLAHELGHVCKGYTLCEEYDEYRADKVAARLLIDIDEFINSLKSGVGDIFSLAEYFQLEPDDIQKYIQLLEREYGDTFQWGEYEVSLNPIYIKNLRTGEIWPYIVDAA